MWEFFKTGYQKIKKALSKTHHALGDRIRSLLGKPWDEETLASLEQILYEADLGSACVEEFLSYLRSKLRFQPKLELEELLSLLKEKAQEILDSSPSPIPIPHTGLQVILMLGINGSGKTTSAAKLALLYQKEGKKVLLGAGDTFRAAAVDQLSLWAKKLEVDIIHSTPGSDPAAVAFDTLAAAKNRNCDVVLFDTAGRLQTKTDLLQELIKIQKTFARMLPGAPQERLLVLDATTGQNALDQVRTFHQHIPLTGLILTKLDGTAKGGIILSLYKELGIPIKWVGVGEQAEDLVPFDAKTYVDALF